MDVPKTRGDERYSVKQRVEQLERDLADREKRLLQAREDVAYAKEEAVQKTKLVVQLQKQLVELEKQTRSGSSAGSGLFGTLLGAASGEAQELARLRQELAVQQEELGNKIKQNEELQVRFHELEEQNERDKKQFTIMIENEVKKSTRMERELARKLEQLDVIRTQNEVISKELALNEQRMYASEEERRKLVLQCRSLERMNDREIERTTFMEARLPFLLPSMQTPKGGRPWKVRQAEAHCNLLLILGDLCFWLHEWRLQTSFASDQTANASKAVVEAINRIKEEFAKTAPVFPLTPSLRAELDLINRAARTLSPSTDFARPFVNEFDRMKDILLRDGDPQQRGSWGRFLSAISREYRTMLGLFPSDDSALKFVCLSLANVADINLKLDAIENESIDLNAEKEQLAFDLLERIGATDLLDRLRSPAQSAGPVLLSANKDMDDLAQNGTSATAQTRKTESTHEVDISKQSDESFLESLESFLQPKTTQPSTLRIESTIRRDSADAPLISFEPFEESTATPIVPVPASQREVDANIITKLKRQYHEQSLANLTKIAELKQALASAEKRATQAEGQLQSIAIENQGHVQQYESDRDVVRKVKEELNETRESYNSQLLTLTERIMDLEQSLQEKNEEVKQLRAERVLVSQLKKTINKTTPPT